MRVLVLAGLITAATAPFAAASEFDIIDCQIDGTRRASAEQRVDAPPPTPAAPTVARPTVASRDLAESPRPAAPERRRNGKPVPDAQLIAPRGVL
ncbi:MAG: hypothetical protein AB7T59_19520 [Hyphomonadaceae bacterium]